MKKNPNTPIKNPTASAKLTRGLRNNNPFNIRRSASKWSGKIPFEKSTDKQYEQFETVRHGIRAGLYLLTKYVLTHGLDTIPKIIHRWAPNGDGKNNEALYVQAVMSYNTICSHVQQSTDWLFKMAAGMCRVESNYVLTRSVFESAFHGLPLGYMAYWKKFAGDGFCQAHAGEEEVGLC